MSNLLENRNESEKNTSDHIHLSKKQIKAGRQIWTTLKKTGVCFLEGHMGSGKTATVCETYRLIKEKIRDHENMKLIIFTPYTAIINEWKNELKKWKIKGSVGGFGEGATITITTMQQVESISRGPVIGHRYRFSPSSTWNKLYDSLFRDEEWQREMGVKISNFDYFIPGEKNSLSRLQPIYVDCLGTCGDSRKKLLDAYVEIRKRMGLVKSEHETFDKWREECDKLRTAGATMSRLYDGEKGKENLHDICKGNYTGPTMCVVDESHFLRNGVPRVEEEPNGANFTAMCNLFRVLRSSGALRYSIAMSATHFIKYDYDLLSPFILFDHKGEKDIDLWREKKMVMSRGKEKKKERWEGLHVKLKAPECNEMRVRKIVYEYTETEKKLFDGWIGRYKTIMRLLRGARQNYYSAPPPLRAHYLAKLRIIENKRLVSIAKGRRGCVHPHFYEAEEIEVECQPPHGYVEERVKASSFATLLKTIKHIRRNKPNAPIVIMGQFKMPQRNVLYFLKQNNVSGLCERVVSGGMADNDVLINAFNNGKITVLICTRGAVGTGVNLTGPTHNSCQNIVFLDTDPNLPTEKQHRGRVQRPYAQPHIDRWTAHYVLPEETYDVDYLLQFRKWKFEEEGPRATTNVSLNGSSNGSSNSSLKKRKRTDGQRLSIQRTALTIEEIREKRLKALEKRSEV